VSGADPARIVAVIANWNGGAENLECIDSLLAQGLAPADVVFVDNGSSDGSLELVRARHPGLSFVCNRENLGFGEASNQGARLALERRAAAVYFANNDAVLEPGGLARLSAALFGPGRVGIIGPRVLYKEPAGRVWCAGGQLTWRLNLSTLLGHRQPDGERWRQRRAVDYVAGCALLARAEVLAEVGLFDARYFAYMEDVDLCLRARRAGWQVEILGEVAAFHTSAGATGGGYNPRRKYMMGVNSVWFLREHAGLGRWLSFVACDVLSLPFLWAGGLFVGRANAALAKAKGIGDGLRGRRVTAQSIAPGASRLWR